MGVANKKEITQIVRFTKPTFMWVDRLGIPLPWVMDTQRSMAMAVMVPVVTRVLVPCMVGTILHASSPRNHFPP